MKYLNPVLLPVVLGFVAGVSQGLIVHYQAIPVSLGEQLSQPFTTSAPLRD